MSRRTPRPRESAWTLTEIMIVVLIVGILLAVAVPNFATARESSRQKACVENLRTIDSAKEQWAMDNRARNGATVRLSQLVGVYIKRQTQGFTRNGSRRVEPRCPSSNLRYDFTIGLIGEAPECPTDSARTGPFPHVLP